MLITYHNMLITISWCVTWRLSALILEQPASAFCYNKLYNIIVNIHSFADHTAEFVTLAARMISLNNHTQWNSWYLLLVITNKHALLIDTYTKNHFDKLSENYLTLENWKKLHIIIIFLQSFHQVILKTQNHCIIIEKVLFIMNILVQYFKTTLVSNYNFFF